MICSRTNLIKIRHLNILRLFINVLYQIHPTMNPTIYKRMQRHAQIQTIAVVETIVVDKVTIVDTGTIVAVDRVPIVVVVGDTIDVVE